HALTQKAATETNNKLRSEKSELQDAVGAISHTIAGLQEELKRLNARVVHSPEKIKEAIAQLTQSIASGRTQLAQKESESRQLAAKIEMLEEILTDIRGCIQQMADAEDIVRRHEEELRKLAAEKENVNQETSNLKNLSVREEQFKYQEESAKGKIERLSQTRQAKREQNATRIANLEKENKEMTARFTEISCKMAEQRARYDELQEEIKRSKSTMEQDAAAIQESYEKLRQQTLEYQDSVILSLEELLGHFYD
ncbi:kinetochore-associated Ndc80 complex subunit nuf2, partial [Linderina pennispora]